MSFTLVNRYNPETNKYRIFHFPNLDRYVVGIYAKNLNADYECLVGYHANLDEKKLGFETFEEAKMWCELSGMYEYLENKITKVLVVNSDLPEDRYNGRFYKLNGKTTKLIDEDAPIDDIQDFSQTIFESEESNYVEALSKNNLVDNDVVEDEDFNGLDAEMSALLKLIG